MNRQDVEDLADEELVRQRLADHHRGASKELQKIALDAAVVGTGYFVDHPFMRQDEKDLLERTMSAVDPELEKDMAGALNRVRYAHDYIEDLGADVFTEAVVDLWRESGAPCRRIEDATWSGPYSPGAYQSAVERPLLDRLLVGEPVKRKAAMNLSAACGALPSAAGSVVLHAMGAAANVLQKSGGGTASFETHQSADLDNANLEGQNLRAAQLDAVRLRNALLDHANFTDAHLHRAKMWDSSAQGTKFSDADMRDSSLQRMIARGANFAGANLEGSDMPEMEASKADFSHANLKNADMRRADLTQASFRDADLFGVNAADADFGFADLSRADLTRASMRSANLRGAKLKDVKLTKAQLHDAERLTTDPKIPGWRVRESTRTGTVGYLEPDE